MSYDSLSYLLLFLPLVLLLYQVFPKKARWALLLLADYVFFFFISGFLLAWLLGSTVVIYLTGLWLTAAPKGRRCILWLGIVLNVGVLIYLKYSVFFGESFTSLLGLASSADDPIRKLAVPVGISFYTLQAVSYLTDVYQGKINADRNFARVALFMSFFPVIMEGPVCRYSDTANSLCAGAPLNYRNLTYGSQRILWGLFKKIVIADRLNPLVKTVFEKHDQYGGVVVILAAVCYTFQLYADFSGCIDITIGVGEMFGIAIPENFRQPFFSKTVSEFWRRWHITLGTWLKDYIFYPISLIKPIKNLGRRARKKWGKHIGQIVPSSVALFAVWLCNGLWHGAGWNYLFFGMYYFVLIVLGNIAEPWMEKTAAFLKIRRNAVPFRAVQTVKMMLIIFTGELFFRASDFAAGAAMFSSIFSGFRWSDVTDGSMIKLGLSLQDFGAAAFGLILVLIVGILHERGISIRKRVAGWKIVPRWGFYYAAILLVVILGAYGDGYTPAALIYAGF